MEERIDFTQKRDFVAGILENDSALLMPVSNAYSLVPENESSPKEVLESSVPKVGHVRRNSTSNESIPYTKVEILSCYLAASMASCHDYSTHGTRQPVEIMMESPGPSSPYSLRSQVVLDKIREVQGECQEMETTVSLVERKQKCDSPDKAKSEVSLSAEKEVKGLSSPLKEIGASSHSKIKKHNIPVKARLEDSLSTEKELKDLSSLLRRIDASAHFSSSLKGIDVSAHSKIQKHHIPIKAKLEVSLLTEKQIKEFLAPVRGIDASANKASNSKLKHVKSKKPSVLIEGESRSQKDGDIQENKEMGFILMNSHNSTSRTGKAEQRKSKVVTVSMSREKEVSTKVSVSAASKHPIKKALMGPNVSFSTKHINKRVSNMNSQKIMNFKRVSCLTDQVDDGEAEPKPSSCEEAPEKTLHVIESSFGNKTEELCQNADCASGLVPSSSSLPDDKQLKCAQNSPSTSSHPEKRQLKTVQNGIHGGQLSSTSTKKFWRHTQKGIHAIQPPVSSENKKQEHGKGGIRVIRPSRLSLGSSMSTRSSHIGTSEYHQTETEKRLMNEKMGLKTWYRKDGVVGVKDTIPSFRKLKFMPRKVVELQPDINIPRRLKFKQGGPGDGQNTKTLLQQKAAKSDIGIGNLENAIVGDADSSAAETESSKVVLRHQDVRGQKIVESLLNSVIEETSSKLVESRKSKVKDLVGAFETLLSHQDTRPSLSIVSAC